jgi:hypothetical protein
MAFGVSRTAARRVTREIEIFLKEFPLPAGERDGRGGSAAEF